MSFATTNTSTMHWTLARGRTLDLRPYRLMKILTVTPDSFSDGGELPDPQSVIRAAHEAIAEGAALLDIGGESTRPGAQRISAHEQINRVEPAIRAIRQSGIEAPISVDTTSAAVARAALDAGADAINDVSAGLEDDAMLPLAAERASGLILMHRLAPPGKDVYSHAHKAAPDYGGDVTGSVNRFLAERLSAAAAAGVSEDAIVLDPGLGFGKNVSQNYELIAHLNEILALGRPVLAAASRKSFIGAACDEQDPADRVTGSVAASVLMAMQGARLFRVHDIAAHRQALDVAFRVIDPSAC